jgi:DUF218 domain
MFTFAKAATAVISPLGTCLLLGTVALVCGVRQWLRMAAIIGGFALLWLWFWSTPMVSHALRTALEADFPAVAMADVPTAGAIVVLGGAVLPASASTPYPNLLDGADRVWHAARLHRAGKAPLLLLSGGSSQMDASESEAAAMQQLLSEWGVPASAMLLEPASRNLAVDICLPHGSGPADVRGAGSYGYPHRGGPSPRRYRCLAMVAALVACTRCAVRQHVGVEGVAGAAGGEVAVVVAQLGAHWSVCAGLNRLPTHT